MIDGGVLYVEEDAARQQPARRLGWGVDGTVRGGPAYVGQARTLIEVEAVSARRPGGLWTARRSRTRCSMGRGDARAIMASSISRACRVQIPPARRWPGPRRGGARWVNIARSRPGSTRSAYSGGFSGARAEQRHGLRSVPERQDAADHRLPRRRPARRRAGSMEGSPSDLAALKEAVVEKGDDTSQDARWQRRSGAGNFNLATACPALAAAQERRGAK